MLLLLVVVVVVRDRAVNVARKIPRRGGANPNATGDWLDDLV